MKLEFLGTRGYIEARTRRHRRHSALVVSYLRRRLMIDCGADWRGRIDDVAPHAIVLTHAHPDHADGLADGAPCPVWATETTWKDLDDFPIVHREQLEPGERHEIEGMDVTPFPVEHSLRAPAVGLRIEAGMAGLFYVPDVVFIHDRETALRGLDLYVGDGATLSRDMVRKQDDRLIGHAPVSTQLTWCGKLGVPRALISHCGSEIVEGDERSLRPRVAALGRERGVEAAIAHDGMEVVLR